MGMVEADETNDALVFASSGVAAAVVELVLESFEIVDEAVDVEASEHYLKDLVFVIPSKNPESFLSHKV